MINDFNDFCTWMYVVVDDIWLKIAPFFKRPGPAPACPDSELLNDGDHWRMPWLGIWKPKCSVNGKNTGICFLSSQHKAVSIGVGVA